MFRAFRSLVIAAVALLTLGAAVSFAAHGPGFALRSDKRATVTPPANEASGWLCRAQRDAMGAAAFSQVWAGRTTAARNAMRACVSYMTSENTNGTATAMEHRIMTAVATCKATRRSNPAAFARQFGSNTKSANALGRCVRSRSRLSSRRAGR